ncbi:hypothetical protein GOP47_0004991 [Adiantum capillus-veneris]|uniref:AMP-activated protein kinase glycogen-binding domain-containing protein n=1 Tax=Adiantum capillus-veneris TaxID=13818 RepID=A0A9D4V5X4_ADICA|nr:hypothetical protein GOP47_0004991 [Adiantum capillus-veneris]
MDGFDSSCRSPSVFLFTGVGGSSAFLFNLCQKKPRLKAVRGESRRLRLEFTLQLPHFGFAIFAERVRTWIAGSFCSSYGCTAGMPMDGVTYPCLSLPLISRPSDATFHQTISFQRHIPFCIHLAGLRGFHAVLLQSASYSTSLSRLATFGYEFHCGVKKQEMCKWRLNSYRFDESLDLESQILDFMNQSQMPDLFPARSELLRAGRSDLVEAILGKGGWMVAGWDLEPDMEEQAHRLDSLSIDGTVKAQRENEVLGELQKRQPTLLGEAPGRLADITEMSQSPQTVLTLERQKGWEKVSDLFGLSSTAKEIPRRRTNAINGASAHSQLGESRRNLACQSFAGGNKGAEVTSEVTEKKKKTRRKSSKMSIVNSNIQQQVNGQQASVTQSKSRHTKSDNRQQNKENNMPISRRIRGLEAELSSTLDVLKSGRSVLTNDIKLTQKHRLHKAELEEVSDALEFCETEIMNKKRELRTARAQQTAFEGKLALELMEFRKNMEEKDAQLERAREVLKTLRTARLVWPNPGREVFLAGSYDGWASWTRMEKSSAGVFVTTLQLYPGQYEIKFIVDGFWTADPNRPRTWENGYENNVLTIV